MNGRVCWLVNPEVLQKHNLQDLSAVNSWEFSTETKRRTRNKADDSKLEEETPPAKTPRTSLIRKLADPVPLTESPAQEEEETAPKSDGKTTEANGSSSTTPAPKAKKRIALISLSNSASKKIKSEAKSTPLTNFLKRVTAKETSDSRSSEAEDMDGIVCLD